MTRRLDKYRSTVLDFGDLDIDLRRPLDDGQRTALTRMAPWQTFAIIAASNPGTLLPSDENERRHDALKRDLAGREARYVFVLGCSPDREHCENSFAVALERGEAIEVARRFAQEAIFWYDGAEFWLVDVLGEIEPIALP